MQRRQGIRERLNRTIEHWKRSLVKALTYRITIIVLDYMLILFLTGNQDWALEATAAISIYTTVVYFAHERVWDGVKWGRQHHHARPKRASWKQK